MHYKSVKIMFPIPELTLFTTKSKVPIHIKCTQIPLTSNNATTGYKLQGSTVDTLYIPSWDYKNNWPYVVLSRV